MLTNRILQLADHIESLPCRDFSMHSSDQCIAGHCRNLFGTGKSGQVWALDEILSHNLDLAEIEGVEIAFRYPTDLTPNKHEAVAMLRNLAETGEIRWE